MAFLLNCYAQQVLAASLSLSLDRHTTTLEEPIRVQVTVRGNQQGDHPPPKLENVSTFNVQKEGTSTQIQIVNGRTTRSVTYKFILYPKKEGAFKIGPATMMVKGKNLRSDDVIIKVVKAVQIQKEKRYYVTATVNKKSLFVNEQVVYIFRFLTRARVANAQLEQPEFKEFWQENIGKQREYKTQINGVTWSVSELKMALFPMKAGKIRIPETVLVVDVLLKSKRRRSSPFDSFFGNSFFGRSQTKRIRLRTRSIELEVRPLPKGGQTKYFSGLVGSIALNYRLSKKSLSVGDSSTLTITLRGDGNLRDAKLPSHNDWANVKVYDDEPSLKVNQSGGLLQGVKMFKKAIVPTREGSLKLPKIRVDYFDPDEGLYKSLQTAEIELQVAPGSEGPLSHVTASDFQLKKKKKIEILGEDIMPLKRSSDALESDVLDKHQKLSLLAMVFLCPVFYSIARMVKERRNRIRGDGGHARRRSQAYKTFLREVNGLKGVATALFYENSSMILRTYLSDKFSIDSRAMTADDIKKFLFSQARKLSEETSKGVAKYIQECEAGQFSKKTLSEGEREDMLRKLTRFAKKLEKEIKK